MIVLFLSLIWAEPLSYEQALDLAHKHNPDILTAELDITQSEGSILVAQSILDPQFTASIGQNLSTNQQFFAGFGLFNTEISGFSWSTGLSTQLPLGTRIGMDWSSSRSATKYELQDAPIEQEVNPYDTALTLTIDQPLLEGIFPSYNMRNIREAQSNFSLQRLTYNETKRRVLKEVAQAYWEFYHTGKLVEIAEQALRIAQDETQNVSAQIEEGNLPPIEKIRMSSAELNAESNLIDMQNQYIDIKEQLLLLLGKPTSTEIQPISIPPEIVDIQIDEATILQKVKQQNPSLLRLRSALSLEKERLRNNKHEALPSLNASARFSVNGWDESLPTAINELIEGALPGRYLGLTLSMPISNLAVQGNIKSQQAALEKSQLALKKMEQSLIQQTKSAIRSFRSAQIKFTLAQTNLILAEQTLEADRALRDAGRKTQTELLSAIKSVEDAKTALERSQTDYLLAEINLKNLMGESFYIQPSRK